MFEKSNQGVVVKKKIAGHSKIKSVPCSRKATEELVVAIKNKKNVHSIKSALFEKSSEGVVMMTKVGHHV